MERRADLKDLNHKAGGIPETGRVNKNREALFWFDRKGPKVPLREWLEKSLEDMYHDDIDCIIITVKERTW